MDNSDLFQGWSWPPNPKSHPAPAKQAPQSPPIAPDTQQQAPADDAQEPSLPSQTYKHRLDSIHQTISSSLQSRAPLTEASQILSADTLPHYTAAGTILQNAFESPNPHDLTSYLAAQNPPTTSGGVNEQSLLSGRIRLIEFVFSEAEKQDMGTQEMVTLMTYVQRLGLRYSHFLASNLYGDENFSSDEDDNTEDADYVPSPERQPVEEIDYTNPSQAITQLIRLTADSCAQVSTRPPSSFPLEIEKADLAGAMEHMRTDITHLISSSNIELESAVNVLDLVFSLGSWHNQEYEAGDKSQRTMLTTKVRPLKLKLVELMYDAAKSLSRVEMEDFIGSALMLWRDYHDTYEDLEG